MNLKILAFPLLIFAIIVFSIWFIYPAYLDLSLSRAQLDEVNGRMENIDQKIQTAERLNEEISNNAEYQNILADLLPAGKNEERIVNELNDIVFGEGMVFYSLAFIESDKNILENAPVQALDEFGNPVIDPVTGQPVYSETIPKIKNSQVTAGAIGDYDKIKGFLRKIIGLTRMNSVASIKIFKAASSDSLEEEIASSGTLKMEVAIDFKYLEAVKNTIDTNDGIFTTGQLNLSALDQIKETKNTIIPELRAEPNGKQNPFVL